MSAAPERHRLPPLQAAGHAVLVLAGWLLFAWFWHLVLRRPWDTQGLTVLIALALVVMPTITLAWVAHNKRLYRRLGPRRAVRPVPEHFEADFNGRRLEADWPLLRASAEVVIEIDGPRKCFRPVRLAAAARAAAPAHQPPAPARPGPAPAARGAHGAHGADAPVEPALANEFR